MHGVTGFVESAALLVFAAFVLVTICSRISVPSIVGYILSGIVIGPAGLGLIAENAALSSIGEIGVVLLLFALGLEFSFEKLVTLRKHVFGLGAVQVAVTTITVSLVASLIFDLAPVPAILIGGAVAMSSTAMCLKVLANANASLRQQIELVGCPRLELSAILDHGRASREPAMLRTNRPASVQQARGDREDGEPPLPASDVGRHWPSPWFQGVRRGVPLAPRSAEAKAGTGARRTRWRRSAELPACTGGRRTRSGAR